jgi:hypothetical protein
MTTPAEKSRFDHEPADGTEGASATHGRYAAPSRNVPISNAYTPPFCGRARVASAAISPAPARARYEIGRLSKTAPATASPLATTLPNRRVMIAAVATKAIAASRYRPSRARRPTTGRTDRSSALAAGMIAARNTRSDGAGTI